MIKDHNYFVSCWACFVINSYSWPQSPLGQPDTSDLDTCATVPVASLPVRKLTSQIVKSTVGIFKLKMINDTH